jgi:hypothetical protein
MRKLHLLQKLFILFFVVFVSFVICSCGIMKRTKSITVTERVTKIDTIIHYVHDTIPIVKQSTLYDTVTIENKTAIAKEYYNFKTQKIVLSLIGKSFDIPVHANVQTKETKKDVVINRKSNIEFVIFFIAAFLIVAYLLIEKLKKT